MKKVFLFLAVSALSLTSCTKDDNKTSSTSMGTLTFTIDGASKTFSHIAATNSPMGIMVMAYNGDNQSAPTEQVSFTVTPDKTGSSAMLETGFNYMAGGKMYSNSDTFVLNVTNNSTSTKTLKGTFSGSLEDAMDDTAAVKNVTNGTFDLKFQ